MTLASARKPLQAGDVQNIGLLWYELATAYATGEVAKALTGTMLPADGAWLQAESASLMASIADDLAQMGVVINLDVPGVPPEAGSVASKSASAAWAWLKATSRNVLAKASTHGKFLTIAGGIAGGLYVTHSWLTAEEETKRQAIDAKKRQVLALIAKLPPDQVAHALEQASAELKVGDGPGLLTWAMYGLAGWALYKLLFGGGR